MNSHSNAVREAKSREELDGFIQGRPEFGGYSEIFDRGDQSVDRYIKRGGMLPSVGWTWDFVHAKGSFDSCGVWGITPSRAIELENLGVPADFAGSMLALLGRADYDYYFVDKVYFEGIVPEKRSEFHACLRGIERQALAKKAQANPKSTMRLGWMNNKEFSMHILSTSKFISSATYQSFNGIYLKDDEDSSISFIDEPQCLLNPLFKKWVEKRPNEWNKEIRDESHEPNRPVGWIENVPPRLMAAATRYGKKYFDHGKLPNHKTSVGHIFDCGDGKHFFRCREYWMTETAKTYVAHRINAELSAIKIKGIWFVWNSQQGFQRHMEASSLKEAVRLWNNRSRKGEPRPLCLNEVRNDRSGTAGFCLAGTKAFLQNRMPFVYRLIMDYSSWGQIPEEIMSTIWDVDFKVFQGYPVP